MVDLQTTAIIILIGIIDILAFIEYYNYKTKLDEARKKASAQATQPSPQPTPVQKIKQTLQTPIIITNSSQNENKKPLPNKEVENLKNENMVLQKKTDLASNKAKNTIQTSLNEVGSKIDDVMTKVQSVKGKINSNSASA